MIYVLGKTKHKITSLSILFYLVNNELHTNVNPQMSIPHSKENIKLIQIVTRKVASQ